MKKIILALDVSSFDEVKNIVSKMGESILWYKVGLELYLCEGEKVVRYLKEQGKNVFLDLKLFDIPNTVAKAVKNICRMEADFTTIHAIGTSEMIKAARESVDASNAKTKILSVTILTSTNENAMHKDMGLSGSVEENVSRLAKNAVEAGTHGIVCSPLEIKSVRSISEDVIIVTPGVRLSGDSVNDQKRVMTPEEAFKTGSDFLVMGRSLVGKDNAKKIVQNIEKSA